jgi:hypothetical protein
MRVHDNRIQRAAVVACALLTAVAGCGGGGNTDTTGPSVPAGARAISYLSVMPSVPQSMQVGEQVHFSATVDQPAAAPRAVVSWRVSNAALATVGDDGRLTATGLGSFVLQAVARTSAQNGYAADSMVTSIPITSLPASISSIELSPATVILPVGTTTRIQSDVLKASPNVAVTVSYQSQQPNVVTVDSSGLVQAGFFNGSARIFVTARGTAPGYANTVITSSIMVNVTSVPGVDALLVSPGTLTLPAGGRGTVTVTALQPRGAPAPVITAVSSGTTVANATGESTEWTVTAGQPGTAVITFGATIPSSLYGFFNVTRTVQLVVNVVAP